VGNDLVVKRVRRVSGIVSHRVAFVISRRKDNGNIVGITWQGTQRASHRGDNERCDSGSAICAERLSAHNPRHTGLQAHTRHTRL
jgi:hypothetical protein